MQNIIVGVVKQAPNFPYKGKATALEPTSLYFQMYQRLRQRMALRSSEHWAVFHEPSGPDRQLFGMNGDELLLELCTEEGSEKAKRYFFDMAKVMRDELEPLIDEAIQHIADPQSRTS